MGEQHCRVFVFDMLFYGNVSSEKQETHKRLQEVYENGKRPWNALLQKLFHNTFAPFSKNTQISINKSMSIEKDRQNIETTILMNSR